MDVESGEEGWMFGHRNDASTGDQHVEHIDDELLQQMAFLGVTELMSDDSQDLLIVPLMVLQKLIRELY